MTLTDTWLTIGKLVAPQGLKGGIKVNPSTDFPERFTKPGERWIQKDTYPPEKIKLISGKQIPGKSIYVIQIQNITNRTKAESLIGYKLLVPAKDRPELLDGEFHLLDLIGLEVKFYKDSPACGTVTNLITYGNDLLEVKLISGKCILVPFVKEIIPTIDLEEGFLIISPPPGLLDL